MREYRCKIEALRKAISFRMNFVIIKRLLNQIFADVSLIGWFGLACLVSLLGLFVLLVCCLGAEVVAVFHLVCLLLLFHTEVIFFLHTC